MICLKTLFNGLSAKETARTLDLSHRTVEHHIMSIKSKFGVSKLMEVFNLVEHMDLF